MNNTRRSRLRQAADHLETAKQIVSGVCDEEQDAMDNMPENLQGSDRYSDMENAVSMMEDAVDGIDTALSSLSDIERVAAAKR